MTNESVRAMLVNGHCSDPTLKREVIDAQWADFGRMVSVNLFNSDAFAYALTHGALKAKNTQELLGMVRAFLLTGSRP